MLIKQALKHHRSNEEPAWIGTDCEGAGNFVVTGLQYQYLNPNATPADNHNMFIATFVGLTYELAQIEMSLDQLIREYFFLVFKPEALKHQNWVKLLKHIDDTCKELVREEAINVATKHQQNTVLRLQLSNVSLTESEIKSIYDKKYSSSYNTIFKKN